MTTIDEGHLLPKSSGGKGFKIEVSAQGILPELTDTTAEARLVSLCDTFGGEEFAAAFLQKLVAD